MAEPPSIEIVAATRLTEAEFWASAPLAVHLRRVPPSPEISVFIAFENQRGLPEVYNRRLEAAAADIVVFVHDDVWIEDLAFADRIRSGIAEFDIIGVAGNRKRYPMQKAWWLRPRQRGLDHANISGAVGHGAEPAGKVSVYGPAPSKVALLDGVLLAVNRAKLAERDVRFDQIFRFHFYDLDFSRTAAKAGLRLGTWPIPITHRSLGVYDTPDWQVAMKDYFRKWGG